MGRSEKRELVNWLALLLMHLLKWRHQPALRGNSWRLTVREQRIRLRNHIKDNPSLKAMIGDAVRDAYEIALLEAERETGLSEGTFPAACPWGFDRIMDDAFWPDDTAQPEGGTH